MSYNYWPSSPPPSPPHRLTAAAPFRRSLALPPSSRRAMRKILPCSCLHSSLLRRSSPPFPICASGWILPSISANDDGGNFQSNNDPFLRYPKKKRSLSARLVRLNDVLFVLAAPLPSDIHTETELNSDYYTHTGFTRSTLGPDKT